MAIITIAIADALIVTDNLTCNLICTAWHRPPYQISNSTASIPIVALCYMNREG